jgi:hypothetical protein
VVAARRAGRCPAGGRQQAGRVQARCAALARRLDPVEEDSATRQIVGVPKMPLPTDLGGSAGTWRPQTRQLLSVAKLIQYRHKNGQIPGHTAVPTVLRKVDPRRPRAAR